MTEHAKDLLWKILVAALSAAVIGSFGWIVKVESELVAMEAKLDRATDELNDLEREVDQELDDVGTTAANNQIEVAKMGGTLDSIKERVDEIRAILTR